MVGILGGFVVRVFWDEDLKILKRLKLKFVLKYLFEDFWCYFVMVDDDFSD